MYRLQILQKAREDMQTSADWYDKEQAGLGERFLLSAISTFKRIETNPLHYEIKFSKKFRFAQLSVFPYLVVFKVKKDAVVVHAVFHTSRNPKKFI